MFSKTSFALAFVLAIASGALAATNSHNAAPPSRDGYTVYNPAGAFVGTDPDVNIRFELSRDWDRGH